MSWASLRDAVLQMPATGVNGFEGALATALSKLTAQNFLLSRSGDQGGIDARSLSGAIMMQAKRYGSAKFSRHGDILTGRN